MGDREDAAGGLDSTALVRVAAKAGYQVTTRMLETFRGQSLLPRPVRTGYRGRAPIWTYPSSARQQLLALLGWRERTKDPRILRMLLWLDGLPIPTSAVRASLVDSLRAMQALLEQQIAIRAERNGLDPRQETERARALHLLSREFAARRGPTSLPRHGRARAADRVRAMELLFRTFALGEGVEATTNDVAVLNRILGTAAGGRRHQIHHAWPCLTERLSDAVDVVALPSLLRTVNDADDVDLDNARHVIVALFRWLPQTARVLAVMLEEENYAEVAGLQRLDEEPETLMIVIPCVLSALRASRPAGTPRQHDHAGEPYSG